MSQSFIHNFTKTSFLHRLYCSSKILRSENSFSHSDLSVSLSFSECCKRSLVDMLDRQLSSSFVLYCIRKLPCVCFSNTQPEVKGRKHEAFRSLECVSTLIQRVHANFMCLPVIY